MTLPLLSEGNQIVQVGRLDLSKIDQYCQMSPSQLYEQAPKWTREIFLVAKRYDDVSEQLIDDNMCTEKICPCLDENIYEQVGNPRHLYHFFLENYMEQYNRTNFANSYWTRYHGDVPLYFTPNVNEGFESFDECFRHWEK